MEFWGVEIKGNKPVEVEPELGQYVRLSQATLGEIKKGCGNVTIYVKIGDQKLVLGRLHPDKFPQLSFDLVFEKTFELSHDWKDGSVHLCGFLGDMEDEEDDFPGFDSSEEEEELEQKNAGTLQPQTKRAPVAAAKPKEDEDDDDDDDEDDEEDDSSDEEDESDDEEILAANGAKVGEDESSDEDSSDEEDEAPAKPVESAKKRPAPAAKTPEAKKSKAASPKSIGGKKGDKFKPQTPKSAGKKFNNGNAFQSQKKGKHSAGK